MARCGEICITDFGATFDGDTDDSRAWADALATIRQRGGGRLLLPAGTSKTTRTLDVPSGVTIQGQGPSVTEIRNSSSDIFRIGSLPGAQGRSTSLETNFKDIHFRDLAIESDHGGHIFVLFGVATAASCTWSHLRLHQRNPARQVFRRVASTEGGQGFVDCLWEHVHMVHGSIALRGDRPIVPAFEVSGVSEQFNSNTLRNLRCDNSWDAPFFKFSCNAQQRNNNCAMSEISFHKCYGGMVHWFTAGNWTCEGLVQYELTEYLRRGDGLLLRKVPRRSTTRHMTFIGCDRRSRLVTPVPPLSAGGNELRGVVEHFVDIRLTDAEHIMLVNCGENPSAIYTVDANNRPLTWIGFDDLTDPDPPAVGPKLLNGQNSVRIGDGAVRARCIRLLN